MSTIKAFNDEGIEIDVLETDVRDSSDPDTVEIVAYVNREAWYA
jgi:hypothetical protein